MSRGKESNGECQKNDLKPCESQLVKGLKEKVTALLNEDVLDQDTIRDVERVVILKISTKHVNLWIRQLEMKRKENGELAGLMGFDEVKKEIGAEKNLEKWAKRCTNDFTRRVRRMCLKK